MIVLVKVNKSYTPGTDPKLAAYRSWVCSSLLDDTKKRNQYKYLVAYYYGKIIGTYCIHGVSLDTPYIGNKRKVKFLLNETDEFCDKQLKNIVDNLIASKSQKIIRTIDFCYLDSSYLMENGVNVELQNCKCALDEIPVLESEEIDFKEKETSDHMDKANLPTNIWLKLSVSKSSFESFRTPHTIETKMVLVYNPNGKIDYKLTDNSTGTVQVVKATLNSKEINDACHILSIFHHDPKTAVENIENSSQTKHVAHYNGFIVEFEAFSDKNLTNRIQHAKWEGNVFIVDNGLLNMINELMS